MNKPKNPFLISGYYNPEYFCDREEETHKLQEALSNGRNVSLISPRRMGKTGLIQHLFYRMKEHDAKVKCFYIDIFSTQNLNEFVTVFGKHILGNLDNYSEGIIKRMSSFFKSIRPVFSFDEITGQPNVMIDVKESQTESGLYEIFEYIKASQYKCYIAIDEFQQITEYPEKSVEAMLRSYVQFMPNTNFIFSGSKKHLMDAMFSTVNRPFYQSSQKIGLKEIQKEAYRKFAINLFVKNGRKLNADVFDYVYDKMLGHTWYIQYIMNILFSTDRQSYSTSDVDKIIYDTIEEENVTYKTYCEVITRGQLRLLKAIACENKVKMPYDHKFMQKYGLTATSSVKLALKALIDKTLIIKDELNQYYVYDRFFSFWLANK